jgi:hypothetical protein
LHGLTTAAASASATSREQHAARQYQPQNCKLLHACISSTAFRLRVTFLSQARTIRVSGAYTLLLFAILLLL